MWDRKKLKEKGKKAFKANYWSSVLVSFIILLIFGGSTATTGSSANNATEEQELTEMINSVPLEVLIGVVIGILAVVAVTSVIVTLVSAFLFNPLKIGSERFFLVNSESPAKVSEILFGYKANYINMVKTLLIRDIFLGLWSLLFCIPAIIKAYSYRMVPYILAENPNIGSLEAITLSRKMMDGHKWRAFVMDLSFIGWHLLGGLTFGLAEIFYVAPYCNASNAELYKAIRDLQKA